MKIKHLIIGLLLGIFLISFVSADCSVTFDKTSYIQGETASADMVCTGAEEKSKVYVLNWTYENGTQLEIDTGTTPATAGQHFYETYTTSSTHTVGVYFNATLTGTGLEGNDNANVTAGSASSLVITEATVGGGWMGLASSFKATIKDELGKLITGGECHVNIRDNVNTNTLIELQARPVGGEMTQHWVLKYDQFAEANDYVVHINCYCGITGTTNECVDEDGLAVANSIGEATIPFTTNTWITFNEDPLPIIYSNGTDYPDPVVYAGFDRIYWHRNVTNNYGQVLKTTVNTYLINNVTGKIYGNVNEGILNIPEKTFTAGNSTTIFEHLVSQTPPTGVYYIRSFFDVFYKNLLVANYIVDTETFNVTSLNDTYTNHNVEARTFDLAIVNMSTVAQLSTVTPINGSVTYLTSGELGEFCINATNNYPGDIYTELSEMNLYNPTTGHTFDLSERATASAQEKAVGTSWLCYSIQIPKEIEEHSDWQFHYTVRIGKYGEIFNCGDECNFELDTEYFWIREESGRFEIVSDVNYPIIKYFGNWKFFEETINNKERDYFKIDVNLTELHEYDLDPNEKIVDDSWKLYAIYTDKMPCTTELYNYTVLNSSGNVVDNNITAKELQWFKNGNLIQRCAIGIENINLTDPDDDYFEIKVWYANYEERQAEALEGIETKTGTFHMSVNCPSYGELGEDIDCIITAQIEETQTVEKEVDFTCYIVDNGDVYSSVNFNQMITRTPVSMTKSFPIPSTFKDGGQYVLQCHGDYYNLGKRRDSFYDTFTALGEIQGPGKLTGKEKAPITGGVVDEGDGIPTILSKGYLYFIVFIIIIFIIILFIRKKKLRRDCFEYFKKRKLWKTVIQIFVVLLVLLIIIGIIFGLVYGFKAIKNSFSNIKAVEQEEVSYSSTSSYSIIQDKLFRGIILTAFIVLMTIILFKALNLRGEVRFGNNRNSYEDKKHTRMQNKLNRMLIREEIKRRKGENNSKIKKISAEDFSRALKKMGK